MGENIVENSRGTIFIDWDGTLVYHNYDPENTPDTFIPNTLAWLKLKAINENYDVVVTTARRWEHTNKIIGSLYNEGIESRVICQLGTGDRILVNDFKDVGVQKAWAINCPRDVGIL